MDAPQKTPDHTDQDAGATLDDAIPSRGYDMVPVVGLGGSAGSISALQQFFQALPADTGLAYVVVIHLGPEHESTLDELLQRCTAMPVRQLHGTQRVEPDSVYVIPPRMSIQAGDGVLELLPLPAGRGRQVAVDLFFRSLADSHGAHAAAVVLSGADGDGAIGIKRIKERGGLTIAQDPLEAQHSGMPQSAIVTGMVDWVLPVADIAPRLLAYFRIEKQLQLPPEDGPTPAATAAAARPEDTALRDVLAFLRNRTGRDFTGYKRATVVRRIARRMQVNGTDTLGAYLNCLRTQPGEAGALLQDLLISVTNFFRDPECFAALDIHMADVVRGKGPGETLRVWVAGCATGEEAYSLAILLLERTRLLDVSPVIQIFATDLDEDAIRIAREGVYPQSIQADVSEERLRRYFVKEPRGYGVRRELREMVVFAQHDILKDSPFSRLDLISCRNLLIYLDRLVQQRVLQTLHFAGLPHARLFLGASESIDEAGGLFTVLDKKNRVFGQRQLPRSALALPQEHSALVISLQPPALHAPTLASRVFNRAASRGALRQDGPRAASWSELHLRLLEAVAPPSILVDSEHEILHLSPGAARFLQFSGGEPSRNLMHSVLPSLRIELRAALYQAGQGQQPAEVVATPIEIEGQPMEVSIRVSRFEESGADLYVVVLAARLPAAEQLAGSPRSAQADPVASQLDRELERLKQHLRDTVEQYEASGEELKASNEELQAMNEELRSATEELETSREELQSINEELSTVNQELKNKVAALGDANSDMQNLINATAIAIVFLDRDLQVMRYTPSAVALFNLIPGDLGRPLADLATRLQYPELGADARRVLDHLIPVEREVGLPDGRWFMARLLPYRTLDDRISGVVLSFIEITERKQAEEMRLWLSAVVNSSGDAIISFALDQTILSWNAGAEAMFGYSAAEVIGQPLALLAPEHEAEQDQLLAGVAEGQPLSNHETVRWRKDGGSLDVALSLSPIRDADGRIIGGTAIARDISQARRAAQALRDSEERMRLLVENVREFGVFSMDLERRITVWNTGAERLLGWREEEVLGQMADVIFTPEDRADGAPIREASAALAEGRASDDRWHLRKDGSRFWASGAAMLMRNPPGEAVGFVKILRDQTAARQAQQALERSQAELVAALDTNMSHRKELEAADVAKDRFLAVLSHELRNPLASIASAAALMGQSELDQGDRGHAGEVVRRQAAAVRALLDDLLDISRLRLGKLTLQQRPTGIAAVVRSGLETAAPVLEGLGHSAAVRLPANELEVHGDPLRLAQVVNNLVTNAAKYTPAGGHISVSAELADGQVVVTVEDDGIGMEPDQIDQMFDMFTQSSAALERAEGGLGIGLALARSIVELHGGWIKASSNGLGHGSRFTFGLPLLRTTSARPEPVQIVPANAPAPQPAPQRGQGTQVLIADDNMDAAWGVAKLLELSGWRPLMASTGEEALKLAQEHQPAAMVLDIGMPDMDGHEVARRLRATPWGRDAVLVAATGWGQESDMRESLEAGFDAHLIKPIDVRQLQGVIEEHLGRRAR